MSASSAGKTEAIASNRSYRFVETGVSFNGVYEKPINLAQGRYAIVANAKEFTLVPWAREP